MPVEIITNFDAVSLRLSGVAAAVESGSATAMVALGETVKTVGIAVIRDHTPVDADSDAEHLRDTTEGDAVPDGLGSMITFRQTKTIPIQGDDVPLATVLLTGRRGGVDIYPVNGQALFWRGAAHPVKHVRTTAVAPNPYIAESMVEVEGTIEPLLAGAGAGILRSALAVGG
jgi:hypothetical protein